MRKHIFHILPALIIILMIPAAASAAPPHALELHGTVTIGGQPAPAGTELAAFIGGNLRGSLTMTADGSYGGTGMFDERLVIHGHEGDPGRTVTFTINGASAAETILYAPGESLQLDLSAAAAPLPPGDTPATTPTATPTETSPASGSSTTPGGGAPVSPGNPPAVTQTPQPTYTASGIAGLSTAAQSSIVLSVNEAARAGITTHISTSSLVLESDAFTLTLSGAFTESGDAVSGTVSSVLLRIAPIAAEYNETGRVSAGVAVDLGSIPSNPAIPSSLAEGAPAGITEGFLLAAMEDGCIVNDVACTLTVQGSALPDIKSAVITMAIDPSWVTEHGGRDAIRIVRVADDGSSEVLVTQYRGMTADGLMAFTAASPGGLSSFGLVSVSPISSETNATAEGATERPLAPGCLTIAAGLAAAVLTFARFRA